MTSNACAFLVQYREHTVVRCAGLVTTMALFVMPMKAAERLSTLRRARQLCQSAASVL